MRRPGVFAHVFQDPETAKRTMRSHDRILGKRERWQSHLDPKRGQAHHLNPVERPEISQPLDPNGPGKNRADHIGRRSDIGPRPMAVATHRPHEWDLRTLIANALSRQNGTRRGVHGRNWPRPESGSSRNDERSGRVARSAGFRLGGSAGSARPRDPREPRSAVAAMQKAAAIPALGSIPSDPHPRR